MIPLSLASDSSIKNNSEMEETNSSTNLETLDDRDSPPSHVLILDTIDDEKITTEKHSSDGGKAHSTSGDMIPDILNSDGTTLDHGSKKASGHTVDI